MKMNYHYIEFSKMPMKSLLSALYNNLDKHGFYKDPIYEDRSAYYLEQYLDLEILASIISTCAFFPIDWDIAITYSLDRHYYGPIIGEPEGPALEKDVRDIIKPVCIDTLDNLLHCLIGFEDDFFHWKSRANCVAEIETSKADYMFERKRFYPLIATHAYKSLLDLSKTGNFFRLTSVSRFFSQIFYLHYLDRQSSVAFGKPSALPAGNWHGLSNEELRQASIRENEKYKTDLTNHPNLRKVHPMESENSIRSISGGIPDSNRRKH